MAIEQTKVIFQYKLDKLVQVFENDKDLTTLLKLENLYLPDEEEGIPLPARHKQYEEILTIFIENSDIIADNTITDILEMSVIRSDIDGAFNGKPAISNHMYRQIIFSFKYGTIKTFFKNNYEYFMPSYDATIINNEPKLKIWQEAFMQEFDIFAQIIDSIKDINNIEKVNEEYLDYIAQLVGFERGDTNLGDSLFREITKNIIEVYRIKGTNYSFELFFNFIGFEIEVKEYWFDKRFFFSNNLVNPFTKETDRNKFSFYLTPNKPTDAVPANVSNPFIVMDNQLTDIRNGLTFDKKLAGADLTELKRWLDIEGVPDEGENFTYFKTNVVEYLISKISSEEIPEGLSKEDENTIQTYTDFLTPIFVSKKVVINITPFEDDASLTLLLKDSNIGTESMFIAQILGDLILKIGLNIETGIEDELWGLNWIDSVIHTHVQELNVWNGGYSNWDDLKGLQEIPLYGGIEESIESFHISYPYIENKVNTTLDFLLESSDDTLMIDDKFYNDIMYMTTKSTHYTSSSGGIVLADDIVTRVGLISQIISGIVFLGSGAETKVSVVYVADGTINVSGDADFYPVFRYTGVDGASILGDAGTKYYSIFKYSGSDGVTTSGDANTLFGHRYDTVVTPIIISNLDSVQTVILYAPADGTINVSRSDNTPAVTLYAPAGGGILTDGVAITREA